MRKFRDYAIRQVDSKGELIRLIIVTEQFYLLNAISMFCLNNDWAIEKMPQRIFHYATVRGMFTPAIQSEITDLRPLLHPVLVNAFLFDQANTVQITTSNYLFKAHYNTRQSIKDQLHQLGDVDKRSWFTEAVDNSVSCAVLCRVNTWLAHLESKVPGSHECVNEDLVEKRWIRIDQIESNEDMGLLTVDLDKKNALCTQAIIEAMCDRLGMCDEETPYISPFTEALVIALLYWRIKHEMTNMVNQVSWIKYVQDLAVKLKPDILTERKAFRPSGKHADKVELLGKQTKRAYNYWKIYTTLTDELVLIFYSFKNIFVTSLLALLIGLR